MHTSHARPAARRPLSVGTQLVLILVASLLVMTAVGTVLSARDFSDARGTATGESVDRALIAAETVARSFAEATEVTLATASEPSLPEVLATSPDECGLAGGGIGAFTSGHLDLFRSDGAIICSSVAARGAPAGATYAGHQVLDRIGSSRVVITDPFDDALAGGARAIAVVAPIRDGKRVVGGFAAVLHVNGLGTELSRVHGGARGYVFDVIDTGSATVLSSSETPELAGTPIEDTDLARAADQGELTNLAGTRVLYATAPIEGAPATWRVLAGVDTDVAFAPARATIKRNALLGTTILAVLVLLGLVFWQRVARPLRRITTAMRQSARDVTPEPIEASGPAEVHELMRSFNALVAARRRYEQALIHRTFHDPVTGLPNHTLLLDRLRVALERARRDPDSVALLFVDLDRFKGVNETLGHGAGDGVLTEVGQRLREVLRSSDTVARMAADEFVILSEGLIGVDQAEAVAERVHQSLVPPIPTEVGEIVLTASIGIAIAGAGAVADGLLRDADVAMGIAKRQGGAQHVVFESSLRMRATERAAIERELRVAMENDQLVLHYQPIAELTTGRVLGAEALVRWEHPTRGMVPPAEFIPIAEESGQIEQLGRWVLLQACTQAAEWQRAGRDLSISVNLSARELTRHSLPDEIQNVLAETGLDPRRLVLEITEGTLLVENAPVVEILRQLKALGVGLSVDDFGVGYSSLSYLRRFPVDQLKIDRVFVDELRPSSGRSALVAAIMDMARALDLEVVAEGIEVPEQIAELTRLGCVNGQGYLLARPAPVEQLEEVLARGVALPATAQAS